MPLMSLLISMTTAAHLRHHFVLGSTPSWVVRRRQHFCYLHCRPGRRLATRSSSTPTVAVCVISGRQHVQLSASNHHVGCKRQLCELVQEGSAALSPGRNGTSADGDCTSVGNGYLRTPSRLVSVIALCRIKTAPMLRRSIRSARRSCSERLRFFRMLLQCCWCCRWHANSGRWWIVHRLSSGDTKHARLPLAFIF